MLPIPSAFCVCRGTHILRPLARTSCAPRVPAKELRGLGSEKQQARSAATTVRWWAQSGNSTDPQVGTAAEQKQIVAQELRKRSENAGCYRRTAPCVEHCDSRGFRIQRPGMKILTILIGYHI
jgi:hypothetical protein